MKLDLNFFESQKDITFYKNYGNLNDIEKKIINFYFSGSPLEEIWNRELCFEFCTYAGPYTSSHQKSFEVSIDLDLFLEYLKNEETDIETIFTIELNAIKNTFFREVDYCIDKKIEDIEDKKDMKKPWRNKYYWNETREQFKNDFERKIDVFKKSLLEKRKNYGLDDDVKLFLECFEEWKKKKEKEKAQPFPAPAVYKKF